MNPLQGMVPLDVDVESAQVRLVQAGTAQFTESLFDESLARLPLLGPVHGTQLSFADLHGAVAGQVPTPKGVILHTGRCGSTLLMRMLMYDRAIMVVAEPSSLSTVHQDALVHPERRDADVETFVDLLAVFDAFARGRGRESVFKLTSFEAADVAWLAGLLPEAPMVFVHRAPDEVVASQLDGEPAWSEALLDRPTSAAPWCPRLADLSPSASRAEQYAALWATVADAALAVPASRMLFVAYDDLMKRPVQVLDTVARQFGLDGAWNRAAAVSETLYYAKSNDPTEQYDPEGVHARPALPADLRARVAEVVGDLPDRLAQRS